MIIAVLGRREQGKTTFADYLAAQRETRVKFDPRAIFGTTSDIIPDSSELYEMLEEREEIIVQPERNVKVNFERCCDVVWEWIRFYTKQGQEVSLAFLVDEARIIDTPSYIPQSLDSIMRMAPRKEVDVIFTAHRPSDISVDIRAIADFWCMFQITQEHDLKVISERCGEEVAEIVSRLPAHHLLIWNDALGKHFVMDRPELWFRDIKKLPRNVRAEATLTWTQ